jgi:hypothetical protein
MAKPIRAKSSYNESELSSLGGELLDWMDILDKDGERVNWRIKEWLNLKIIPYGYIEFFKEKSKTFGDCWDLAIQIQEAELVKRLVNKNTYTSGIEKALKEYHGWKDKTEVETTTLDVTPENLEAILSKKFPKRDKFKAVSPEGELV